MEHLIFHIDVNSAYLSWEAVYRLRYLQEELDIRTVPSAIGGDRASRRGIILASSIPAKRLGVRTPEPIVDALKKCPELLLFDARFDFYKECSESFIGILARYSDLIEQISVDEAFVDMSEVVQAQKDPVGFADMIRNRIRDELGFTVNVGVAQNKLLAKTASDFTKPDRTHTLFDNEVASKMWPLPVKDLMFVGRSTAGRLNELGIHTIGELAAMDPAVLEPFFGKSTEGMIRSANGIGSTQIHTVQADNKGYSCSTTMADNVTDCTEAKRILLKLVVKTAERLRRDDAAIRTVAVSIRDGAFDKRIHQTNLDNATDITNEIYAAACAVFDELWHGEPIRALGVHVSNISEKTSRQYSFFDKTDYEKQRRADAMMDVLRSRFGRDSVKRASLIDRPGTDAGA